MVELVTLIPLKYVGHDDFDSLIQCINKICQEATCIVMPLVKRTYLHYIISILEAIRAFNGGRNIAKKFELEVIVRFYCDRQVSSVIKRAKKDFRESKGVVLAIIDANPTRILKEINVCGLESVDEKCKTLFSTPYVDIDLAKIALTSILLRD